MQAVEGSAVLIEDVALSGESMLLLGRPGMGKTTAIREIARLLSESSPAHPQRKRVVIVDTSNEIGGDGNVPHPGVGLARRMQVCLNPISFCPVCQTLEVNPPVDLRSSSNKTSVEGGVPA